MDAPVEHASRKPSENESCSEGVRFCAIQARSWGLPNLTELADIAIHKTIRRGPEKRSYAGAIVKVLTQLISNAQMNNLKPPIKRGHFYLLTRLYILSFYYAGLPPDVLTGNQKEYALDNVTLPLDQLSETVKGALFALGLRDDTLATVQAVLMYAQKRGSNQGLAKIKERTILPDTDAQAIVTDMRSINIAHLNGGGNVGMLVLQKATEQAIELTRLSGLSLVTTNNTRSSTGAIGFYARQLAEYGFIGLVLAGSPKVMAVAGGIDPVMGTNPIAIAIPTGNDPLVLDMATAATTWFAVLHARDHNQTIKDDYAIDCDGFATTSPAEALTGALRTFGGNKGSGLALMFEMLTGPLAGASIAEEHTDNRGNFIIGIDPAVVLADNSFVPRVDELLGKIRNGRQASIRLPGDQSEALAKQCELTNSITIERTIYEHVCELATFN